MPSHCASPTTPTLRLHHILSRVIVIAILHNAIDNDGGGCEYSSTPLLVVVVVVVLLLPNNQQ